MVRRTFLAAPLAPMALAQPIEAFQLPAKRIFDKAMPRYPNAWFYIAAPLAPSYAAAVKRLTQALGDAMQLPEFFPPFDNPEGCDFEARIEHLQPWIDSRRRQEQHAHAFHLRYYFSALDRQGLGRVFLDWNGGKQPCWRLAASVHYEVGHANPNHADVEDCPICGRTGEYAAVRGSLVEQVHDPLGLELLLTGKIRGQIVRREDRNRSAVGSVLDMRGVRVRTLTFAGQQEDRNTHRIGIVVVDGTR